MLDYKVIEQRNTSIRIKRKREKILAIYYNYPLLKYFSKVRKVYIEIRFDLYFLNFNRMLTKFNRN